MIVTDGNGGGSGAIVAVVLLVVVILVGAFLFFGINVFRGGTTNINADVKVDSPAGGH